MREPERLTESRTERGAKRSSRRRKIALIAGAVCLSLAVVGALVLLLTARASTTGAGVPAHASAHVAARAVPVSAPSTPSATAASRIEVPDLVGMGLPQAATVLKAAGLLMKVSAEGTATSRLDAVVRSQLPAAGTVAVVGSAVVIAVPTFAGKSAGNTSAGKASAKRVVVIDPGHQSRANDMMEPIGPGSTEMKPRMTAGTSGVTSGVPEYEIDLEIATNLQDRLEAAGVHVVMTRTTNDVDLSNSQRALIANAAKADLFVRIHADGNINPKVTGVSTLYPASNEWTKAIVQPSAKAATAIQHDLVAATGAADDGSTARGDIAGFNWAKVPSVLVQTGSQSNQVEDRLLSSSGYQDRVAQGIADGVLVYLGGGR